MLASYLCVPVCKIKQLLASFKGDLLDFVIFLNHHELMDLNVLGIFQSIAASLTAAQFILS